MQIVNHMKTRSQGNVVHLGSLLASRSKSFANTRGLPNNSIGM